MLNTDSAVKRTMRISILEGGITQTFLNWTTGSVVIAHMLHYGATSTEIGLLLVCPYRRKVKDL